MTKGFKINVLFLKLLCLVTVTIMRAAAVNTNAVLGVVTVAFSSLFKEGRHDVPFALQ